MNQDCKEKIDVGHYYGDLGIAFFRGGGVKWAYHVAPLSRITKVETQYIIISRILTKWTELNMGINLPLVKKPPFQYFSMEQFGFLIFSTIQG